MGENPLTSHLKRCDDADIGAVLDALGEVLTDRIEPVDGGLSVLGEEGEEQQGEVYAQILVVLGISRIDAMLSAPLPRSCPRIGAP